MAEFKFKYRALSKALYDALIHDPFYATLEKAVRGIKIEKMEAMLRYMDYSICEGEYFGQTFIPTEHDYGVSVWLKPLELEKEIRMKGEKKEFFLEHMGHDAWQCYQSIVEHMASNTKTLISEEAWYLSIIGLSPSYQNKGLGSGLINPVLELTDNKGIVTYLETFTFRNVKFYERLGFATIESFSEPTTGADYWVMTRQPK